VNSEPQGGLLQNGSFIGGTYRVLDFVGQGGMGYVYKVEHLMMARVMALKLLRPEQVSESVWQRFRNEALAIARLEHSNIVKIYDMSQTAEGLPYYTMDLLVGQSLDDYLIDNDQLPVELALPIFRQVCAGLAYAHDRGIVHRDIKPGNIMLIEDQKSRVPLVKIVDFGIAKLNTFDGAIGQGLTRPGEIMGSPLYMSPEQCSGMALDYRSDMYSVGVTMFHALTGRPPLLGKTAIETTAMHQSVTPPAMSEKDPETEFPPALEKMVARLLAKSPDHRFDSLADVASDLLALERADGTGLDRTVAREQGRTSAKSHSIYEKSITGVQNETSGRTTSSTEPLSFIRNKNIVLVSVTSALLATISIFALYFILQQRQGKEATVVSGTSAVVPENTALTFLTEISGDDKNLSVEEKEIKDFLKSNPPPYSHVEGSGAKKLWIFQFPERFSLGVYFFNFPVLQAQYPEEAARGRVVVRHGGQLKFTAGNCVEKFPQLLALFKPDDIDWLVMDSGFSISPALAENVIRLKSLRCLNLKTTHLIDADLVWLDKLVNLNILNIIGADITSEALAKSAVLSRLNTLSFLGKTEITPVLNALIKAGKIHDIEVLYPEMTPAHVHLIAAMKQLKKLSLTSDSIVDQDLTPLSQLTELEELNLESCTKLTGKTLELLPNLKHLKLLKMPFEVDDAKREAALRKALPGLQIY